MHAWYHLLYLLFSNSSSIEGYEGGWSLDVSASSGFLRDMHFVRVHVSASGAAE